MDRKNYDPEVISTFDIIGCYFVDVYYNHLYLTANDIHNKASRNERAGGGRATSLTEEYKNAVHAYMRGVIEDEKYYKQTVTGMQKFYQTFTKYSTISLTEFIDRIINTFLPKEYAVNLRSDEKEFFLNDIISSVIKEFSIRAVDIGHLRQIIDNHTSEYNTRAWVDEFIDLQIVEREKIFNKFTQKRVGGRAQQYEKVDVELAKKVVEERDKIWHELENKVRENTQLSKNLADSKTLVVRMHGIIKDQEAKIADLQKQVSSAGATKKKKIVVAEPEPERSTARSRRRQFTFSTEDSDDKEKEKEQPEKKSDRWGRKDRDMGKKDNGSTGEKSKAADKADEVSEGSESSEDDKKDSDSETIENEGSVADKGKDERSVVDKDESKSGSESGSESEEYGVEAALKKIAEQETPRVGFRLRKRK